LLDRRVNFNGGCRKTIMNELLEIYEKFSAHAETIIEADELKIENTRLREAIKAAMREIVNEDFDEAYHQLYKALDPKFENPFGVDIEKAV
jgi:DUF1680 family protein